MLRILMGVLSSLRLGAQVRAELQAIKRQSIVVTIAVLFLVMAIAFGLVALYHVLIDVCGFSVLASAGIMTGSLFVIAVLIFLSRSLFRPRKSKPKPQAMLDAGTDGLLMVEKSVDKAMQEVGPLTLLAVAFAAGLLASRRR